MIQHTVVFSLKHPKGSTEEKEFLAAAAQLALIPGVHNFQSLLQIGGKNDFDYALSMEFDDMVAYAAYNTHPDHNRFVATYWARSVEKFLELDYEPII